MPDLATLTNFLFEITFPVSLLCPNDYWAWGAMTEGHLWITKDLNLNLNARIWLHNSGQVPLTSQSLNAPSVNHPGYIWERICIALWTHTWMNARQSTHGRPLWQLRKIRATGDLAPRKWWSWDLHVPIQLHLLLTRPWRYLLFLQAQRRLLRQTSLFKPLIHSTAAGEHVFQFFYFNILLKKKRERRKKKRIQTHYFTDTVWKT